MKVNKGKLAKAIKALNDCKLATMDVSQLDADGKALPIKQVMTDFVMAVETVPLRKQDELPDLVVDFYNENVDGVERKETNLEDIIEEARTAEKPEKQEKPVKEKKEKPVKEKKEKVEKDNAFSLREGTKYQKVFDTIKANPGITMYELKQQDWNDKNDTYYNILNKKWIPNGIIRKEGKGYFVNAGF